PRRGLVRIGIIPTMAPYLLPALTPALSHTFPELDFTWTEEKTPTLVDALDAGTLDAAILALESELGELSVRPLATDPFLFAAPPGHPLITRAAPPRAEDLADLQVYVLDDGHCFRDQVLDVCYRSGAREAGFRATSLATLVSMAASSPESVTLLPAMAARIANGAGLLATRPFTEPVPKRTVALAWRGGAPIERTLDAIHETLVAAVSAATAEAR
ncbi:MAG: LysR family transcriptional regulator, partial [Deltaproteobacteria bacterium]